MFLCRFHFYEIYPISHSLPIAPYEFAFFRIFLEPAFVRKSHIEESCLFKEGGTYGLGGLSCRADMLGSLFRVRVYGHLPISQLFPLQTDPIETRKNIAIVFHAIKTVFEVLMLCLVTFVMIFFFFVLFVHVIFPYKDAWLAHSWRLFHVG